MGAPAEADSMCDLCGKTADPAEEECVACVCRARCHHPKEQDVYHTACLKKYMRTFSRNIDTSRCYGFVCPTGKGKTSTKQPCAAKVAHSQKIVVKKDKPSAEVAPDAAAPDATAAGADKAGSKKIKPKATAAATAAAAAAGQPKGAKAKLPALNSMPSKEPGYFQAPYLPTEYVKLPPMPEQPRRDPLGRNAAAAAAASAKAAKKNAKRSLARQRKLEDENDGWQDSQQGANTAAAAAAVPADAATSAPTETEEAEEEKEEQEWAEWDADEGAGLHAVHSSFDAAGFAAEFECEEDSFLWQGRHRQGSDMSSYTHAAPDQGSNSSSSSTPAYRLSPTGIAAAAAALSEGHGAEAAAQTALTATAAPPAAAALPTAADHSISQPQETPSAAAATGSYESVPAAAYPTAPQSQPVYASSHSANSSSISARVHPYIISTGAAMQQQQHGVMIAVPNAAGSAPNMQASWQGQQQQHQQMFADYASTSTPAVTGVSAPAAVPAAVPACGYLPGQQAAISAPVNSAFIMQPQQQFKAPAPAPPAVATAGYPGAMYTTTPPPPAAATATTAGVWQQPQQYYQVPPAAPAAVGCSGGYYTTAATAAAGMQGVVQDQAEGEDSLDDLLTLLGV